ncbi:hypothetical protein COCVIDRAFT_92394 [Bipolaris victoriae FI3]|uniref:Uncharacterized protein n=1 Tax=Bipolaris victoriae (strain FI3) TaxID=930091 RepID=W7F0D3_BIPV3|nr:hypothetical protein COCVIDRAFT_92394 [Bipolaris victoriae FI3]
MSYLHFSHTHARERTPEKEPYTGRPLLRRNTYKRDPSITLSDLDDGHDDYPYPANHKSNKISSALTVRNRPSQLERYNILSNDTRNNEDDERLYSYDRHRTYRYSDRRHHSDDEDAEERALRLRISATLDRPSTSYHNSHGSHLWPSETLHRSDRWIDEAWETRERSLSRERTRVRRNSFWGGFEEKETETQDERWSRYHRVSDTKTEEIRPLSGWRRRRIVGGN